MANVAQRKAIGNATYEVSQLPWGKAIALWTRLLSTLGPAIGKVAGGIDGKKGLFGAEVGPAIAQLSQDLSAEDFEYVVGVLCESGTVRRVEGDKRPLLTRETWDLVFTGKILESFKVIAFALEVNYGDFLGGLKDALAQRGEDQAGPGMSSSDSLPASIGESGA